MNVQQLIEILEEYDPEYEIEVNTDGIGYVGQSNHDIQELNIESDHRAKVVYIKLAK